MTASLLSHPDLGRWIARGLAALWSAFWIWFGLACGIGDGWRHALIHAAIPGGIFLLATIIAWNNELIGSVLLLALGLVVLIGYPLWVGDRFPLQTVLVVLATMAAPPLIAGWLLARETWLKPAAPALP